MGDILDKGKNYKVLLKNTTIWTQKRDFCGQNWLTIAITI